jgi:hypothetical protein
MSGPGSPAGVVRCPASSVACHRGRAVDRPWQNSHASSPHDEMTTQDQSPGGCFVRCDFLPVRTFFFLRGIRRSVPSKAGAR